MSATILFQIALEIWGIVVCIVASICLFAIKPEDPAHNPRKLIMELCCIFLLASDILAWRFLGQADTIGFRVTRIANFFVYFINFIYLTLFGNFLWKACATKEEKLPKRLLAVFSMSTAAIVILIISQFNGFFYYFDEQNIYHRGPWYMAAQMVAIAGIVLCFTILMQFRKRLDRITFLAMLSYFAFPAIATVIQTFYYGLALQNFSIVCSTQIIFAVDMIEMSLQLNSSKDAYRLASHAAEHDAMTGLLNKPAGIRKMEEFLAQMSEDGGASLIFVDIDNFKHINDTYGHGVGDFWIIEIAKLLMSHCRQDDIACRFGGDEYIVLMKNVTDAKLLYKRWEHFSECLQKLSEEKQQEIHCSIGVCRVFGAGQDLTRCLDTADQALYEVKRRGKNGCVIKDLGQEDMGAAYGVISAESFSVSDAELSFEGLLDIFHMVVAIQPDKMSYKVVFSEEDTKTLGSYFPMFGQYDPQAAHLTEYLAAPEYRDTFARFISPEHLHENIGAAPCAFLTNAGVHAQMYLRRMKKEKDDSRKAEVVFLAIQFLPDDM